MRIFPPTIFAAVLIAPAMAYGQSARDREAIAETVESSLRSDGCSACRVWVSGQENRKVEVLDPEAARTPNDYNGRPAFWYGAGFRTVIYYSRPGAVYAKHTLDADPGPAKTAAAKEAARREACKGEREIFGRTPSDCSGAGVSQRAPRPIKAPARAPQVTAKPNAAIASRVGTSYVSVAAIDARVDSIDKYVERNPGRLKTYARMPNSTRLTPVRDSTAWPDGLESSINVVEDSSGRLLRYFEAPTSESGDWYAEIVHYFAPDGRVILWTYEMSGFSSGCTEILREHKRKYLRPDGGVLKREVRYTDKDGRAIVADSCDRRGDDAPQLKRRSAEFLLPAPSRSEMDKAGAACYSYRDTVTLSGVLQRETHPGRPNYESIAAGDEAESGFYLHLVEPVCTRQGADDAIERALDTVWRVQLVLDSAGYARLQQSLGSSVAVRGSMFSSYSGHHHAPLLLTVQH